MSHNLLADTLGAVTVGHEVCVGPLAMFPLLGSPAVEHEPGYLTLDEAIGLGWAEITEVSEQGSVPELRIRNRAPRPTLILDGEELIGAKQNRVVNLTILVPAAADMRIPVSCVEAGRWRARSRSFAAAPRAQYAAGRAKRVKQVSASIAQRGTRTSDQADVWADIAEKAERLHSPSPTAAMEQIFIDHAASLEKYVAACAPAERQRGALFAIEGRIVGLDLFDCSPTYRKLYPKLVRSYALDAIEATGPNPRGRMNGRAKTLVPAFLASVGASIGLRAPAVGLGHDIRFSGEGYVGAALAVDGAVLHLSAFTE